MYNQFQVTTQSTFYVPTSKKCLKTVNLLLKMKAELFTRHRLSVAMDYVAVRMEILNWKEN